MSTSGNERRGLRRKLIAALSTVALAVSGVVVAPHAGAYVEKEDSFLNPNPDNNDNELQPKVSVNVTPTDKEVQPGDTVELEFTGSFEAPFPPSGSVPAPGESDVKGATIALKFSDQLEGDPQIDPSAFVWKSGEKRNAEVKPAGGGYIVDFGYISANDSFTYKVPVKVAEDIEPGTEFSPATIEATTRIAPQNQFPGRNDAHFTQDPNDRCTLISKSSYVSENGNYGGWLSDLWLGTRSPYAELGEAELKFFADGQDITSQVMERAQLHAPDSADHKNLPQIIAARDAELPGRDWRQVYDWGFTPNYTVPKDSKGEIYLPSGTIVEVTQPVTDTSPECAAGGDPVVTHDVYVGQVVTDQIALVKKSNTLRVVKPDEKPTPQPETPTATTTKTSTETTTTTATATTTAATTTVTPTKTAPTVTTTLTKTAPAVTTTPTHTATPVTTTSTATETSTETESKTTTTTATSTETATETTTATVTDTAGCDCEPTTVTETTTVKAPKRGTIGDRVWLDENGDGKQDPDEKAGIPGVTVVVTDKDGNEVTRTVSDEDGNWKVDVEPGEYTVTYAPGGHVVSDKKLIERTVKIKPGEENLDIDLGVLPGSSIGDRVWNDNNGDGVQDEDEKGVPNVIVEVSREGEPTRTTYTDEQGNWRIDGLDPETEYEVRFIKPEGWKVTGKVPGNTDEEGLISKATLKPKEYNDTYDLGLQAEKQDCDCEPETPGTIGDHVWLDENGDGKQDPDEKAGIPGVTVVVTDKDGNEVTRTVTDEDGNWKVDVTPGEYTVEYLPGDYTPSDLGQVKRTVTVKEGDKLLDVDLGVLPKGTVGDRVWNDENGDGIQDEGEKGIADVTVQVIREGEPIRTTTTDQNGNWSIEGLDPNKEYEVRFIKPEGWEVTGKVPGATDEEGLLSKVILKPGERNDSYDLGLHKTKKIVEEEPTVPATPTPGVSSAPGGALERCVANAVASPILYLVPVALLAAVGGQVGAPYMDVINQQVAKINAEIQAQFSRNTPDWGTGNRGRDNDNDQLAELRAQIAAANRQLQQLAADPNVRQVGTIAAAILGVAALGGVLYDWCSNEKGEAFTSLKGSSSGKQN